MKPNYENYEKLTLHTLLSTASDVGAGVGAGTTGSSAGATTSGSFI